MSIINHKVTCNKCKGESIIGIEELTNLIRWKKVGRVISGRSRLDGQWGWQCACGNNSLLSKQEAKMIKNPVNPLPQEIEEVRKALIIVPDKQFTMRKI